MTIDGFYFENIRCFDGPNFLPIRPLTILVGENNTGKSTILGSLSAIGKQGLSLKEINFNSPPFQFGRFEDIVTYRSRHFGKKQEIGIGISNFKSNYEILESFAVICKYINNDGKPSLNNMVLQSNNTVINLFINNNTVSINYIDNFRYSKLPGSDILKMLSDKDFLKTINIQLTMKEHSIRSLFSDQFPLAFLSLDIPTKSQAYKNINSLIFSFLRPDTLNYINVAPIRMKPERTYESYKEQRTPDGSHIPFEIERYLRSGNIEYIKALNNFGVLSGLFSIINVKQLVIPKGSKFELTIKLKGESRNIVDVGYGVSQVLPILVDTITSPAGSTITLQQPEVHLHPRAQAELGSLFVQLVNNEQKTLIIETHSDYIIDRIRQEVALKKIDYRNVQIVYTEMIGTEVKYYIIELDENGNIINAPASYRDFFVREQLSLINRGL
jgi:AAA15 family ATPase/GTPase